METLFKPFIFIIIGAIILIGIALRLASIDSESYFQSIKITVASFGIFGVLMTGFVVTDSAVVTVMGWLDNFNILYLFIFLSLVYPVLVYSLDNTPLLESLKKIYFSPIIFILLVFFSYSSSEITDGSKTVINYENSTAFIYIATLIALGMVHALLGTIVAAINISLVLITVLYGNSLGFSLENAFDFMSLLGIESPLLKWILMALSTALALSEFLDIDKTKEQLDSFFN